MSNGGLLKSDRAVSAVISVVLLVAVTVILASVVSLFAVGLDEQARTDVPEVDFDFTYTQSGGTTQVTISHEHGQNIDASDLEIQGASVSNDWPSDEISTGDSWTGTTSGSTTEIVIVWRDDDGQTSHVITRSQVPT